MRPVFLLVAGAIQFVLGTVAVFSGVTMDFSSAWVMLAINFSAGTTVVTGLITLVRVMLDD